MQKKGAASYPGELGDVACLPLKKRIFDPLLPKRLAEVGIELNTPCVPWRHVGGYIDVNMLYIILQAIKFPWLTPHAADT